MDVPAIVIPANDESAWIDACLAALAAQRGVARARVIVSANACTDDTVARAHAHEGAFAAMGWRLDVIDAPEPGKLAALNRADAAIDAEGGAPARIYLDADVRCDPDLVAQLAEALAPRSPLYATGTLAVAPARTGATRLYARVWRRLPFVRGGAVGAGLFAVNRAGRGRWGTFPDIISDDTFVRLHFAPGERVEVPARYHWPMVEGWSNLVRVRRRQDAGVRELAARHPELMANEGKAPLGAGGAARLAATDPAGFAVYAGVALAVRARRSDLAWTRGR
ncbi:glycosyltransferase family 2 protein [Jannaschia sp. LMIT008]|uniref:glycosyltransferase family 2 protein n=1 Tax=Jannaschia maritima TaxID=3032585 RepID=UPI002810DCA8|nr:glycosyltransferase [Jannaschia sp. LMIT008]